MDASWTESGQPTRKVHPRIKSKPSTAIAARIAGEEHRGRGRKGGLNGYWKCSVGMLKIKLLRFPHGHKTITQDA